MILVSTCLLGLDTRYDGGSKAIELLVEYCRYGKFIPICPEQLGGLSTPRTPSEITGGSGEDVLSGKCRVIGCDGTDRTKEYIKGAEEVIKIAYMFPVKASILKQRSPSCGSRQIYDGTFSGSKIKGHGVAAALLREHNIPVYSEEDITRELLDRLVLGE